MEKYIGKKVRLKLKSGTIAEGKVTDYDLAINSGDEENQLCFYPTKIEVNNEKYDFAINPVGMDYGFYDSQIESIESIENMDE